MPQRSILRALTLLQYLLAHGWIDTVEEVLSFLVLQSMWFLYKLFQLSLGLVIIIYHFWFVNLLLDFVKVLQLMLWWLKVLLLVLIDVHLCFGWEHLPHVYFQYYLHLRILFLPIYIVHHFWLSQQQFEASGDSWLSLAVFQDREELLDKVESSKKSKLTKSYFKWWKQQRQALRPLVDCAKKGCSKNVVRKVKKELRVSFQNHI